MKLLAKSADLDVINLFLHEQYDTGCFAETTVAITLENELSMRVADSDKYWRICVLAPYETGLDRFIITTENIDGTTSRYSKRCHSEEDLKALLPKEIFEALKIINELTIKIGDQ